MPFAEAGSQRWIQVAVNRRPALLLEALRKAKAISDSTTIHWASPLENDGCREYRDIAALKRAGLDVLPIRPLNDFWPMRGPVWDAIGTTSDGIAIFIEAKAHIPEAASPGSRATPSSLQLIERSLAEARRWYAPKATSNWSGTFYQYSNRLAHHYLLKNVNRLPTILVFLYFVNASEMNGPENELEWKGAIRLLHAALGLPEHLESRDVFEAFLDVKQFEDTV